MFQFKYLAINVKYIVSFVNHASLFIKIQMLSSMKVTFKSAELDILIICVHYLVIHPLRTTVGTEGTSCGYSGHLCRSTNSINSFQLFYYRDAYKIGFNEVLFPF